MRYRDNSIWSDERMDEQGEWTVLKTIPSSTLSGGEGMNRVNWGNWGSFEVIGNSTIR